MAIVYKEGSIPRRLDQLPLAARAREDELDRITRRGTSARERTGFTERGATKRNPFAWKMDRDLYQVKTGP